jgi:ABC-type Mn2+/Zn2+ transport system permease subunit
MNGIAETIRDFRDPLLGCLLVAFACGLLGIHVLGRRMVLVGAALPQAAAAGIAMSFVAEGWPWTKPGSPGALLADHDLAAVMACAVAMAALARRPGARRGAPEAAAGAAFVLGGSLAILLVLRTPRGAEEIRNLVSGEILGLHDARLAWLAATLGGAAVLAVVASRRRALVSLDPETAAVLGVRVRAWDAAFLAALAVTVARSVHAAGTLFVFAYLLLPAVAALALARTVAGAHAVAAGVALLGAGGGFLAATHPSVDAPVGPAGAVAALLLAGAARGLAAWRRRAPGTAAG